MNQKGKTGEFLVWLSTRQVADVMNNVDNVGFVDLPDRELLVV
jgi:hypothetical protein